jgi:lantibiotic modifying enzyme
VLLAGASTLGEPAWREAAEQAALRGIDTYENADLPWPPGVNGGVENPSLMLGSAGVGWFLLRVAQPDVPSVLFFA